MSDLLNISDFSYSKGLDLSKNQESFTYLYGLSDFWELLFQDTAVTNLMLEATSVQASDIYSKFLQLCTGISIADIGPDATSQLKLGIVSTNLNLPTNVEVLSGIWENNFCTIKLDSTINFSVGDTISITNTQDVLTYRVGNGINVQPILQGGDSYTTFGSNWNGTYVITSISLGGYITYYQPIIPGLYTYGGRVSVTSIGIETYNLNDKVTGTRFIANRAFLPSIVLEENIDYVIYPDTQRVSFSKALSSYGFPSRVTTAGDIEYSLWFVDVRYDEDLIYEHYPVLLGLTPLPISNQDYRNFLYGLYYIYTGGPSLSIIEKGINLILGVPLARNNELVLEVRPYLNTKQFIVITDLNSYVTPEGLPPAVGPGDILKVGDELSKWVEILDYHNAGSWWYNYGIEIPPELMPDVPIGGNRTVVQDIIYPGYDVGNMFNSTVINEIGNNYPYVLTNYNQWLMENYLKYNTFLVKVNIIKTSFLAAQKFANINDLILKLKPSHTFPIYTYNIGNIFSIKGVSTYYASGKVMAGISSSLTGLSTVSHTGIIQGGLAMTAVTAVTSLGTILVKITLKGVSTLSTVGLVIPGERLSSVSSITAITNIVASNQPSPLSGETTYVYPGNVTKY